MSNPDLDILTRFVLPQSNPNQYLSSFMSEFSFVVFLSALNVLTHPKNRFPIGRHQTQSEKSIDFINYCFGSILLIPNKNSSFFLTIYIFETFIFVLSIWTNQTKSTIVRHQKQYEKYPVFTTYYFGSTWQTKVV